MNGKWLATHAGVLALCLLLSACAHESSVRMDQGQGIDTQWGFPHSEARMDVHGSAVYWADAYMQESGWVRTTVTVDNVSSGRLQLLYRGCPVQVQVFQDEALEGTPVWDSFQQQPGPCEPRVKVRTLDPVEEMDLSVVLSPDQILGDSLQEGTYYFAAVVRPNGVPITVPAGAVQLHHSRDI